MKMKMSVQGTGALIAHFHSIAEKVPENARKVMHRATDRIVKEAKLNTPRDDGELEDSIRKEITYGARGRLQVQIVVGGVVRGVNVDRYAAEVHENYEGMLVKGPGPNTLAKMQANPGRWIGSKFLERARQAEEPKLLAAMIESVTKDIKL